MVGTVMLVLGGSAGTFGGGAMVGGTVLFSTAPGFTVSGRQCEATAATQMLRGYMSRPLSSRRLLTNSQTLIQCRVLTQRS